MSRRRCVSVAVACLSILCALDAPVSGQSPPPGAGAQAPVRLEPASPEPRQEVVVLPFANISGDPVDDWMGAGIAETVMADLQEGRGLSVIGRERIVDALRTWGASDLAAPDEQIALDVGRQLGATWLVGGGYQRLGDLMRITARFVDLRTGTVIRRLKVDGHVSDLFGLQDRIVEALNQGLPVALGQGPIVRIDPGLADALVAEIQQPDTTRVGPGDEPATTVTRTREAAPTGSAARETARAEIARQSVAVASPADPPREVLSPREAPSGATVLGVAIDGPPPPVPPAVVSRDAEGRVTLRAIRLDGPLTLDGRLDDEIYQRVPPVSDFIQQVPDEGEPATEKTEAWVFFDDENLYVSARCWDSHPERMIANELRRDNINIAIGNANFAVVLDTFYDRRNGYAFQTNPLGALRDQTFTNEGNFDSDWNTVWQPRTARFRDGWTTEIAIPFKSLRYEGAGPQVWSINMRRIVRWKNEHSYLSAVPPRTAPLACTKFRPQPRWWVSRPRPGR